MRRLARHRSDAELTYEQFRAAVKPGLLLIERALQGQMVIPEFESFRTAIDEIYGKTSGNTSGAVADYIPQLARVNPEQYGAALCTVDGQRHSIGDAATDFCVQSTCKPLNYCLALEEHGVPVTQVVAKVGQDEGHDAVDLIASGEVDLVINTPRGSGPRADGDHIRRAATRHGVACVTTVAAGLAAATGVADLRSREPAVRSLQEYHQDGQMRLGV